jgi:hypothetical protein
MREGISIEVNAGDRERLAAVNRGMQVDERTEHSALQSPAGPRLLAALSKSIRAA